ncbi:MAG: hypothetical protein ACJAW3_000848 [Lentimonas sp.]|jgi:uncharacterized protein
MDISPTIPKNRNIINGYGINNFKINEKTHKNSLILTPNQLIEVKIDSVEDFFSQDLSKIIDIEPEIMLIGTGNNHQIIPAILKNKIKSFFPNTSIDEMNTASACRTYNILMMEDRNVAVLLIKIT